MKKAHVVDAGEVHPNPTAPLEPFVEGVVLEHPSFPEWRFRLDLRLDGVVIGLGIRPAGADDLARWTGRVPGNGVTSTRMLRRFPLDDLVRAARAEVGLALTVMSDPNFADVLGMPADMRAAFRGSASMARGRRRPHAKAGRRNRSDSWYAETLHEYLLWVRRGGRVADFAAARHISVSQLNNIRREAKRRDLYIGTGKAPQPGGRLTDKGRRALARARSRAETDMRSVHEPTANPIEAQDT